MYRATAASLDEQKQVRQRGLNTAHCTNGCPPCSILVHIFYPDGGIKRPFRFDDTTGDCHLCYFQVTYTQTTGVRSAVLGKNGVEHLMRLDRDSCAFPIVLSFNFMVSDSTG